MVTCPEDIRFQRHQRHFGTHAYKPPVRSKPDRFRLLLCRWFDGTRTDLLHQRPIGNRKTDVFQCAQRFFLKRSALVSRCIRSQERHRQWRSVDS